MNALLKAQEMLEGPAPPQELKSAFSEYLNAKMEFSKLRIQSEKALATIYEKKANIIKIVEKINGEQSPASGS